MKYIEKLLQWIEKLTLWMLKKIMRLAKHELSEEQVVPVRQGIRFLVIGVWNMLCSYVVYIACIVLGLHYLLCHGISFCFSVLNSFFWSRRFVFREQGNMWRMLGKVFLSFVGTGLILQGFLLVLWVDVLGVPEIWGPMLNICILTPINFLVQKFWAYK